MHTEYHKEYSRHLGRDMEFKVYGHDGKPVLVFPCQNGRFFDWEGFGMLDTLQDYLDAGRIQLFTADTIDANRALEIGMVNHVVPADQLMDEAMKLAEKICKNAQKAIRASKLAIRRGMDCDISTAVSYEALAFATCFGTEDQKEGMQAFLEKRKEKHFKNA